MKIRRFEVNMSCASCAQKIMKKLDQYKDLKHVVNPLEKMVSIEADENKYSDEEIKKILKEIGYEATRI